MMPGNGETDGTSKRPTATNQNVIANMKEDIRETVYNNLTFTLVSGNLVLEEFQVYSKL
ncbi:hypothetical protein [Bacteroides sp. CACC 737]|uniref:hypothetical protein n=1 Tax=Bacteroides sp. CACC 737 TaxID=2755405 RepID=UPI002105A58F|nr:hypothetical protein [Bacteroides sp. CACC 737]